MSVSERKNGTVKWFNPSKGYGFIEFEDNKEIFVHYTAIQMEGYRALKQGQIIEFEIEEGPKGILAIAVIPVS
jgi:CspA family cold shock protein